MGVGFVPPHPPARSTQDSEVSEARLGRSFAPTSSVFERWNLQLHPASLPKLTMIERTIPRTQWVRFCEGFSGQPEGWLVRIDVADAGGAVWTIARDEPLGAGAAGDARRTRLHAMSHEGVQSRVGA